MQNVLIRGRRSTKLGDVGRRTSGEVRQSESTREKSEKKTQEKRGAEEEMEEDDEENGPMVVGIKLGGIGPALKISISTNTNVTLALSRVLFSPSFLRM